MMRWVILAATLLASSVAHAQIQSGTVGQCVYACTQNIPQVCTCMPGTAAPIMAMPPAPAAPAPDNSAALAAQMFQQQMLQQQLQQLQLQQQQEEWRRQHQFDHPPGQPGQFDHPHQ